MFKVGDKVKVGLFEGQIHDLFFFKGEQWADVLIHGKIEHYKTNMLIKKEKK